MENLDPGRRRAARERGATAKKFQIMNQMWLQEGEVGFERSSLINAVSAGELSSPGERKKANDIRPIHSPAYGMLMLRGGDWDVSGVSGVEALRDD